MRAIKDEDAQKVSYIPLQLKSGQLSNAIPLSVTAEAGDTLRGSASPDAVLMGRFAGVGAYVDLSASPLVMPGGESAVEIKIQAGEGAGLRRATFDLRLPENSAAGWTA